MAKDKSRDKIRYGAIKDQRRSSDSSDSQSDISMASQEAKTNTVSSLYSSLSGWGGFLVTGLGLAMCFVPMGEIVRLALVASLLGVGVIAAAASFYFDKVEKGGKPREVLIPAIAIGVNAVAVITLIAMALVLSMPGLVGPFAMGVTAMSLLGFAAQNGFWTSKENKDDSSSYHERKKKAMITGAPIEGIVGEDTPRRSVTHSAGSSGLVKRSHRSQKPGNDETYPPVSAGKDGGKPPAGPTGSVHL